MIPISTDTPIQTPWVNYSLVGLNILVFAVTSSTGNDSFSVRLRQFVELVALDSRNPELHQFFTYQFLHAGFAHIAGNMLFLWTFGNPVNSKMGNGPYFFFYLAGGVFAAVGYGFYNDGPDLAVRRCDRRRHHRLPGPLSPAATSPFFTGSS